ncbi:MAG: hypothetical protein ABWY63_14320 [Hyphomicrobiaceae bacterium]
MSLDAQIEALFESFDSEADPLIDEIIVAKDDRATVLMANGLAIRLTGWLMGPHVTPEEAGTIATSMVTELLTLRRNIAQNMVDQ